MKIRRQSRCPILAASMLLGVCCAAASCFEPPISEEVEVRFLPQGGALVTTTVTIRSADEWKDNRLVQERIEQARRELHAGEDFWSRQIEAIGPEAERLVWEKENGKLTRAVHRVMLEEPSRVRPLLAGAAGSVTYTEGDAWAELALRPLPGLRATAAQRRETVASLDKWSARISSYLANARALYAYIEEHPGRADICLESLFRDLASPGAEAAIEQPARQEEALIESVLDSMTVLLGIFTTPDSSAYSPDETFRLAHDPFAAPLRVRVPGKILESEGFVPEGEQGLAVPEPGLYGAIRSLEGRWLAPDPLVAHVEHGRAGGTFDPTEFGRKARKFEAPPTAAAVRAAIESWLLPAPVYRVRWSTTGLKESSPPITSWDDPALTR